MNSSAAYMFPGQGAQHPGMGAALFAKHDELVTNANDVLGFDVAELCKGEDDRLHATEYTQPALFLANHLHWIERRERGDQLPAYMLGHSLGQYNALVAAGVLDFDDAIVLVRERGRLMSKYASGGMAAVMKLDLEDLQFVLAQHPLGAQVDIANINSRQQSVIAAKVEILNEISAPLQEAGAFLVPLKVGGAFHSRLTAAAADAFTPALERLISYPSQIKVICNVTAKPIVPAEIKTRLREHIIMPVQWRASIEYLLSAGVTDFQELGVGTTLSGLQRYIVKHWNSQQEVT